MDFIRSKSPGVIFSPLAGGNWAASVCGREWIPDSFGPDTVEDMLSAAARCGFDLILGTGWWDNEFLPWPKLREEIDENTYRFRQHIDTPHGPVEQVMSNAKRLGNRMETPAFRKIDGRLFDLLEMIASRRDEPLASIRRAVELVGERGLLYLGTSCPHTLFGLLDGMSVIYAWDEDRDLFRSACECAFAATMNVIEVALQAGIECVFLATYGLSLFSPRILEEFALPYLKKIAEYLHARGKLLYIHECGRMKIGIERGWWNEVLPDILEGFESPPVGDIDDLAWARRKLDPRIIIKGNVSIADLLNAEPDTIRVQSRHVRAAVEGYPHILGSACSILYGTPVENVRAMAENATADG